MSPARKVPSENLDVVTIIGSNRSYNILNVELLLAGVTQPGPVSRSMTGLDKPYLDWVKIGEGFGEPSVGVDTAEALRCKRIGRTRLAGELIQLECQQESHSIGVEKVVPLGLIVNELVTNAAPA